MIFLSVHPLNSPSFPLLHSLTRNLYRTFKELSKAEEQLSLCRELCEDLAEDMKKEGLKVVNEGCFIISYVMNK